jgi:two-component sensor histidine kinase
MSATESGLKPALSYGIAPQTGGRRWLLAEALLLPVITSLVLLIPTVLYWAHARSVFDDFQQSRGAQYRLRLSKRIQAEVDSQLRPLRRLRGEIVSGDVASPAAFAISARSICREEPTLKYIAWVDTDGRCISAWPADGSATVFDELTGAVKGDFKQLFKQLNRAADGMLLSFPAGGTLGAADRIVVLPINSAGADATGAIVTCETTQAMLGTLIPPDASAPIIVEVKDERGRVMFASDGATTPAAQALLRTQDVDQIAVLNQSWSMSLAAAPPGLGQRPASDTDAFLLSGLIVALLGGATVAQAGRHRRRERQRTAEHLAALESLHAVAASISCKPRGEAEVLRRLLAAASGLLHMPKAFVCEAEAGGSVQLAGEVGFDPPLVENYHALLESPVIQRCIRTGETLTESAAAGPAGVASLFIFPLFAGEERIGIMALCDAKPRRFTDEDFRLARLWASQAAVTLANQRLAAANEEALKQQRRLNQQVRLDADAKAMLLRELNHRVKNNLAGIVGLLSAGVPELSEEAQQWLDRAIARIETLARAHELFVGTSSELAVSDLVTKTLEPIWAIKPPGVELTLDLAGVNDPLSTDQAVTLAMVVHELASNALQHGAGDRGTLCVRARRVTGGRVMIEVIDDGSGEKAPSAAGRGPVEGSVATLPVRAARTGIGLQLVRGLVGRELHGTFSLCENAAGGRTATVEFGLGK